MIPLKVSGAFHSRLMDPAAKEFAAPLSEVSWTAPTSVKVVSNVTGDYYTGDGLPGLLEKQLNHAVLWENSIRKLRADGVDRFVEIGPGKVLTGMMRRIDREALACNIEDPESLEKARAALA